MSEPFRVLLVEDNPADVAVTKTAWGNGSNTHLHVVTDGEEAATWIEGQTDAPDLVLLDLNLPRRSGHEVLKMIRERSGFQRVPVIVVSSSERNADIDACYRAGANCYVVKPDTFDDYLEAMEQVEQFWRYTVKLPA